MKNTAMIAVLTVGTMRAPRESRRFGASALTTEPCVRAWCICYTAERARALARGAKRHKRLHLHGSLHSTKGIATAERTRALARGAKRHKRLHLHGSLHSTKGIATAERTRTSTDLSTAPLMLRVYLFHHGRN